MAQKDRPLEATRAAAIDWWVRRDAGPLGPADRAAFDAWLAQDAANRAAFEEIRHLWGDLAGVSRGGARHSASRAGPRPWLLTAIAMGALGIFLVFDEISLYWRADHRTGIGEVRTVALEDGTRVHLDAQSAIAIDYSHGQRNVWLLAGEAWFEVATDPARPFTVSAGDGRITALGTAFDVVTDTARTEVTVTAHRVAVVEAGGTEIVEAGQQTAFGPGLSLAPPHAVDLERVTAWKRGKLIFHDRPLGEVVAQLARYHRGYVFIADAATRARRVSGVFSTKDPIAALRAVVKSLGLHAITLTDYLILLRG